MSVARGRPTMALILSFALAAAGGFGKSVKSAAQSPPKGEKTMNQSIYDFTMKDINGKDVNLSQFKGKVLLIVNTASKCGFTPQYEGLEKLYETYKDKGLVILGFPANNFLWQEPGTDDEIKQFCSLKYGVTFPMFSKISVKGKDQHPLYAFLTDEKANPGFGGAITWNFNKFLVGRDGKVVGRFGSKVEPGSRELVEAVEKALAAAP
jgi:glutathione peroxidase